MVEEVPEIETSLHVISKLHVQAKEIEKPERSKFSVYKHVFHHPSVSVRYSNRYELFRRT